MRVCRGHEVECDCDDDKPNAADWKEYAMDALLILAPKFTSEEQDTIARFIDATSNCDEEDLRDEAQAKRKETKQRYEASEKS